MCGSCSTTCTAASTSGFRPRPAAGSQGRHSALRSAALSMPSCCVPNSPFEGEQTAKLLTSADSDMSPSGPRDLAQTSRYLFEFELTAGRWHLSGQTRCVDRRRQRRESTMGTQAREYSLAELLDHPIIGWQMKSEGIDSRCLDLMLDESRRNRHRSAKV